MTLFHVFFYFLLQSTVFYSQFTLGYFILHNPQNAENTESRPALHAAHSSVRLHNSYFQFRSNSVSETLSDSRLRCPVKQVGIKFSRLHMKGFFFFSFLPPRRTGPRSKAVIFYSQFFTYQTVCCLTPRDPPATCFSCLLMSLRRA